MDIHNIASRARKFRRAELFVSSAIFTYLHTTLYISERFLFVILAVIELDSVGDKHVQCHQYKHTSNPKAATCNTIQYPHSTDALQINIIIDKNRTTNHLIPCTGNKQGVPHRIFNADIFSCRKCVMGCRLLYILIFKV